ncbi:unnamed protein product, partial [Polarella glacialis]
ERAKLEAMREGKLKQDTKESELRRRRQVEMELRLEELERQLQLAQVARERVLRKAQLDAAQAQEASEELQRRRHEVAARGERRAQMQAIAEERRKQRETLKQREKKVDRESERWRQDVQWQGEQLGGQAVDELRKEYEARRDLATEEALTRDMGDEELLRQTLQELKKSRRNLGGEVSSEAEDEAAAADVSSGDGGEVSRSNRGRREKFVPQEAGIPEVRGAAHKEAEAAARRDGALEELIKQREAELETLWHEFDVEARELSDEDDTEAFTANSSVPF